MPKINARHVVCLEKAAELHKKHPTLSVRQLMKLANFTSKEQECRAMRMSIHRHIKKWTIIPQQADVLTTPPPDIVRAGDPGTLSSVTNSMSITSSPKKVKSIQNIASAAQQACAIRIEKKNQYKVAFKQVTNVYAREKGKEKGGMSAQSVVELIAKEFKVNLSARTIQRKVKSGDIGSSPVRHGPKGSIPELHYKNLAMAFESNVTINQINGVICECRHKKLFKRVQKVLHATVADKREFLKRLLRDTAVNLKACKVKSA
jgi:hypothetical protein